MKKFGFILLLFALTFCMIFMPPFLSGQKEAHLTGKVVYRSCQAGNRPKLTERQVARLYCNGEIAEGYSSTYEMQETDDVEPIRQEVEAFLTVFFAENEEIQKAMRILLSDKVFQYSRQSSLIKIDNQPTAVNLISCYSETENGFFKLTYEEKTKTILGFFCYFLGTGLESMQEPDRFWGEGLSAVDRYYQEQLQLNENEYFFSGEKPIADGSGRLQSFQIDFGIRYHAMDKIEGE